MKRTKQLFSILVVLVLAVAIAGCTNSPEDTVDQTNKNVGATSTSSTPTWTPREWTAYDKTITLSNEIYIGTIDLDHTSTITIDLNILSNNAETISYIGIIPATDISAWKNGLSTVEYKYLKQHVSSGTFKTTLSPGSYYFVVGLADPVFKTLASGTEVIKAGHYVAIPVYLNDILYATDVEVYIDIREDLDVTIAFLTSKEYQVYSQGGTAEAIRYYEKAKSGYYTLTDGLYPDSYYFILDNTYSLLTKKTVDYEITANVVYPATIHLKLQIKEES